MGGGKNMAWLLALIAVIAVIGLAVVATSGPSPRHQMQNKTEPNDAKALANSQTNQDGDKQHDSGTDQQKGQNYWKRFVAFVDANDKVVTALSTVVIAAFTLALFVATYLLWNGAEKTAERQLRAYIGVNTMETTLYPFESGGFAFIAHAELRNFGQTPAYDVEVISNAKVDVFGSAPFDEKRDEKQILAGKSIAFRDAGFHVNHGWQISVQDAADIRDRKKQFFLWGTVKYRDAFDKHRYFKFRVMSGHKTTSAGPEVFVMAPYQYEAD